VTIASYDRKFWHEGIKKGAIPPSSEKKNVRILERQKDAPVKELSYFRSKSEPKISQEL